MVDKKILDQVVFNEWSKNKTADIKPSGLDFVMDTMPFKAIFKQSVQDEKPFIYEAEGKSISFKPIGMWWTTPQGNTAVRVVLPSVGSLTEGKVKYPSALGTDIDIVLSTEKTRWRKEIIIKSLQSLGTIPADAEYLEICFEIETDFDIEGWDKKSELKFNTAIKLSELSQLESVKTWDNHIISKPKEGEEPEDPFERCDGFLRVVDDKYFLVKRIPAGYLRDAVYPVATDVVITFGSEYVFKSVTNTVQISCSRLDDTHFVVAYRTSGAQCRIGVVSSGDVINYGTEQEFASNPTPSISCAALDATHFVISYRDSTANRGYAVIGVVTGDAIALGSAYTFNNADSEWVSCSRLDDTHFVTGFKDSGGSGWGHCIIGVVSSGDVIAFGSEYNFNSAVTIEISVAGLDATHFVVGFQDFGQVGYCRIGEVSAGDEIAYGSEYSFSGSVAFVNLAAFDDTFFVIGWKDWTESGIGRCIIGEISSGDVITYGSPYTFNSVETEYISVAIVGTNRFVVGFVDDGAAKHGIAIIGEVSSGDVIAYGSEYPFNSVSNRDVSVAGLDDTHFVVGFNDLGGDGYGIARIGVVPSQVSAPTVITDAATSVEDTTATGQVEITDTGGEDCDYRGIAWDTISRGDPGALSPAASDYSSYNSEGPGTYGTGAFPRSMTSLPAGTTIYARGYAHNSVDWSWGSEVSFLTKPAAPTSVAASENDPDKVVVTWTKKTGATAYQVYRDGAPLGWLGDVATFDDNGADAPTITPGAADASDGTSTLHVGLSLAGEEANNGTTHTYKVRARNASGESDDSGTTTGYRLVGSLEFQWQRSAADSDASYGDIIGATTENYNDTAAPSNGQGRYYRCVLNANGAAEQISSVDRGYRSVIGNKSPGMAVKLMDGGLI